MPQSIYHIGHARATLEGVEKDSNPRLTRAVQQAKARLEQLALALMGKSQANGSPFATKIAPGLSLFFRKLS